MYASHNSRRLFSRHIAHPAWTPGLNIISSSFILHPSSPDPLPLAPPTAIAVAVAWVRQWEMVT